MPPPKKNGTFGLHVNIKPGLKNLGQLIAWRPWAFISNLDLVLLPALGCEMEISIIIDERGGEEPHE